MNEFKLKCPACGQHMLATPEWIGRELKCPSCSQSITVTAPVDEPVKGTDRATTPAPSVPETPLAPSSTAALPSKAEAERLPPGSPLPKPSDKEHLASPSKASGPAEPSKAADQPRVAVLSPAVKLEMVRAVRRRISEESAWLPATLKGATAYAAKLVDGEPVLVDVRDPQATRFSLIGAFLLEMHQRRVVRTAVGRRRFLDEEIPEALQAVVLEQMNDEDRERAQDSPADAGKHEISHSQCLAVLDALEAAYQQRTEQRQIERAKRKLGGMRLPDLVKKLETKVPIAPEEVATALYHELMEVRRRLDNLERRLIREHPGPAGKD